MGSAWVRQLYERFRNRREAVRNDWIAWLPEDKLQVFKHTVAGLDSAFHMLSVALDGALALRARGELVSARRQTAVAIGLSEMVEARLGGALRSLEEYAWHFGPLPAVSPLEAEDFRSCSAQAAVRWNSLVQVVLLGTRNRFFHKLNAVAGMVETLAAEFRRTAGEIADGVCVAPDKGWKRLDDLHYDLNNCLQETKVMLKSFLRAIPAEQLDPFRRRLVARSASAFPPGVRISRAHP